MRRLRLSPSVFYRHLVSVAMIGVTLVLVRLLFRSFLDIGASPPSAFWTTLLVCLSPPLMIFAAMFATEMLSALLCLVVFSQIAITPASSRRALALAGAANGLLVLIHIKNVGVALPLAALAAATLARRRDLRSLPAFGGAMTILIAARTASHVSVLGHASHHATRAGG